jgi:uncharacterized membrane protein YcaP (DUF421 family)
MSSMIFFSSWSRIGRVLVLAIFAYSALVLLLRVSGKRTLTKLNVFDFVFVVALGSSLATTILSPDTTLAEGIVAILVLVALQVLLSWLCVRSHMLNKIINGEPVLLMHRGNFLNEVMQRERVTAEEIRAAVRNKGLGELQAINSVVLETDGTFSIVSEHVSEGASALCDIKGHPASMSVKRDG